MEQKRFLRKGQYNDKSWEIVFSFSKIVFWSSCILFSNDSFSVSNTSDSSWTKLLCIPWHWLFSWSIKSGICSYQNILELLKYNNRKYSHEVTKLLYLIVETQFLAKIKTVILIFVFDVNFVKILLMRCIYFLMIHQRCLIFECKTHLPQTTIQNLSHFSNHH